MALFGSAAHAAGVRWFWPGEFGEHLPVNERATLPALDERRVPACEIRSIQMDYPSIYYTKTFNDAARKWARRSRLGWVRSAIFGHSWGTASDMKNDKTFQDHPEWFALVKKALGIDKATALTKSTLAEKPARPAKAKAAQN